MGDQLKARINTIEHKQGEFEHDIREMKGQLTRLTVLIKRYIGIMSESTHRSPSFSLQPTLHSFVHHSRPSHEPYIPNALP